MTSPVHTFKEVHTFTMLPFYRGKSNKYVTKQYVCFLVSLAARKKKKAGKGLETQWQGGRVILF